MSGYSPRENTLATAIDRMEDLREAVQGMNRSLAIMLKGQAAQSEMLSKILAAVTTKPGEKNPVEELLRNLVEADRNHAEALARIETVLTATTRAWSSGRR